MFMVDTLIRLCIIGAFRVFTLEFWVGVCSIFSKTYTSVRELCMILIKERIILIQFSQVPAEVQVIRANIGKVYYWTLLLKHKCMGHSSEPCFIERMAYIVENTMILH